MDKSKTVGFLTAHQENPITLSPTSSVPIPSWSGLKFSAGQSSQKPVAFIKRLFPACFFCPSPASAVTFWL
jgi:hypothetical protein